MKRSTGQMRVATSGDRHRVLEFTPGFDKRGPTPKTNYGIHGAELRLVVVGKEGAVQFLIFTNWMTPKVREEHEADDRAGKHLPLCIVAPMAADLGYHSKAPVEHASEFEKCEYLDDGAPCWYDGSSLNAEPYYDLLCSEGLDAVWLKLENYYDHKFRSKEDSDD